MVGTQTLHVLSLMLTFTRRSLTSKEYCLHVLKCDLSRGQERRLQTEQCTELMVEKWQDIGHSRRDGGPAGVSQGT